MKLILDHTQRLNLHALLGAQQADVGCIRAIWAVQDKLALSADEERAIELRRECVNGQERTVWNPTLHLDAREFDLTEAEMARIKTAVETWSEYGASADRGWLESVLLALGSSEPK